MPVLCAVVWKRCENLLWFWVPLTVVPLSGEDTCLDVQSTACMMCRVPRQTGCPARGASGPFVWGPSPCSVRFLSLVVPVGCDIVVVLPFHCRSFRLCPRGASVPAVRVRSPFSSLEESVPASRRRLFDIVSTLLYELHRCR